MADESICRGCFHSYVCEQFNEHRDSNNKKCHFFNDHFVPAADVVEVKHGCRYCSTHDGSGLQWDFEDIEVTVTLQNGALTICNCYGDEADMPIRFCPNCGARMGGE